MNPEEVIERLKTIFAFGISNCIADKIARDTTFAALEKQIQTKPGMYIGDYEFERWPICPKCKGELHPNGEKFCSDCGQAIDWSEEE